MKTPRRNLPPLPASLSTPIGPVPVRMVHNLTINGKPGFGAYEVLTRKILMRTGMSRGNEWLTLEHERFHRICRDAGISMPPALEERLADAVGADRVYSMLHPDETVDEETARKAAAKLRAKARRARRPAK